jgi:MerR family transcriptional regulator, copper efflux regulator
VSIIPAMDMPILQIGQAAKLASVSPDTLRHYERIGLLPKVARTQSGYRQYGEDSLDRIRFIRNSLRFGFSLKQVSEFLRARDSGNAPCRNVRAAAEEILTRVDQQLKDLKSARREILRTLSEWDQRLDRAKGRPARLLQQLQDHHINADCVSLRLKRAAR